MQSSATLSQRSQLQMHTAMTSNSMGRQSQPSLASHPIVMGGGSLLVESPNLHRAKSQSQMQPYQQTKVRMSQPAEQSMESMTQGGHAPYASHVRSDPRRASMATASGVAPMRGTTLKLTTSDLSSSSPYTHRSSQPSPYSSRVVGSSTPVLSQSHLTPSPMPTSRASASPYLRQTPHATHESGIERNKLMYRTTDDMMPSYARDRPDASPMMAMSPMPTSSIHRSTTPIQYRPTGIPLASQSPLQHMRKHRLDHPPSGPMPKVARTSIGTTRVTYEQSMSNQQMQQDVTQQMDSNENMEILPVYESDRCAPDVSFEESDSVDHVDSDQLDPNAMCISHSADPHSEVMKLAEATGAVLLDVASEGDEEGHSTQTPFESASALEAVTVDESGDSSIVAISFEPSSTDGHQLTCNIQLVDSDLSVLKLVDGTGVDDSLDSNPISMPLAMDPPATATEPNEQYQQAGFGMVDIEEGMLTQPENGVRTHAVVNTAMNQAIDEQSVLLLMPPPNSHFEQTNQTETTLNETDVNPTVVNKVETNAVAASSHIGNPLCSSSAAPVVHVHPHVSATSLPLVLDDGDEDQKLEYEITAQVANDMKGLHSHRAARESLNRDDNRMDADWNEQCASEILFEAQPSQSQIACRNRADGITRQAATSAVPMDTAMESGGLQSYVDGMLLVLHGRPDALPTILHRLKSTMNINSVHVSPVTSADDDSISAGVDHLLVKRELSQLRERVSTLESTGKARQAAHTKEVQSLRTQLVTLKKDHMAELDRKEQRIRKLEGQMKAEAQMAEVRPSPSEEDDDKGGAMSTLCVADQPHVFLSIGSR